jgi:hypothetical protein
MFDGAKLIGHDPAPAKMNDPNLHRHDTPRP